MIRHGQSVIRHGQPRAWAIHGEGGVYKSSVFGGFPAIFVDWVISATAIWVVHFGHGKTLFYTVWDSGNTPS